jgi:hypothetical protein
MSGLFLCEGLHIVLELLDRDLCVGSCLLLCLDDFIKLTQLCVEPRQRRTLFLQPALRLGMRRLSSPRFRLTIVVWSVSAW